VRILLAGKNERLRAEALLTQRKVAKGSRNSHRKQNVRLREPASTPRRWSCKRVLVQWSGVDPNPIPNVC